ncbi:TPA: universal stress protein [Legionella pneumophila]|uniref:Universal stress protein n=2 Tax=Gammaproteobacteria TaxID=1236 RepID=A0A3A6W8L6_LEGPN|nr:universal stress protein [Legionella pneumophila]ERH43208.1 universal stress protein [Legionella pneumophila str. Leg01/11]ERH44541.1 universal stress protein [Legionella pneumophila str. Leg01/53]ERI48441.1 universal stress protein [Legionella pneumophila str. Leg01/20]AMQ28721.1 universal stress protein [Legionella pneumophila subsp. pneumophila]AMV15349.1 Universal stress protein E [Legionella pneumophila]
MHRFHNILFVSHGIKDETEVLQLTLRLAAESQAQLRILITCPPFPDTLSEYKASYEEYLIDKMNKTIQLAKSGLGLSKKKIPIPIEVECGSMPDVRIIRHVLKHSHDLLIKEAETLESRKGFKAVDMELLRKCPCALFLYRPLKNTLQDIRVAVAIDPKDEEPVAQDLSLRLLEVSHSLNAFYQGKLRIVSCWDFVLENYLRDSVWLKISETELEKMVVEEKHTHSLLLRELIKRSHISGESQIEHLKGHPEDAIPHLITHKKIDILVMGTVARTGIAGFIIGNTAENILQKINCSLLALKPQGFVSPVKAY